MRVIGYRPRNRWVRRPLDWGWLPWLKRCGLAVLVLAAVLAAFVGPRQSTIRSRYQIAQLRAEIERLESEQRTLLVERERLSSPVGLATQLEGLGLIHVSSRDVAFLDPNGRLRRAPIAPTRPSQPAARTTTEAR
ncbi:MAG: hypothetical protein KA072_00885 [Thermoanaerobaculaceae bacterium]|nr:hypothetical protein [Thermoanaerobaculaceae bacterium]MDI9622350.1 hypothetical protein [Acidobacteriota bacterium]NLH09790.1 hypothetical protein [Holophagae bacterium]HPW56600.1 hypothetical protein [Thermoanaerobaculaceae bacterium]